MTSKEVEIEHLRDIDQILANTGIECLRSPHETPPSEASFAVEEQMQILETIPEEMHPPEEEQVAIEEEIEEERPYMFPTPSLRKILPERIRKIEEYNRLHVLPEEFNTEIDPQAIPKIALTAPQVYIDVLAELVGCNLYKNSLAEYWFLDTLANLLRRGQEDGLDRSAQAVLILWFCEWMKEMQYFDAADRKRMLRRFKDIMLSAAAFIGDESRLPTPADIGVYYKEREVMPGDHKGVSHANLRPSGVGTPISFDSTKHVVTFDNTAYECSLRDLTKILHYIFDLFSTDYQYDLVRSVFTNSPTYALIDAPFQIQQPKTLYFVAKKSKGKEKSPKKDKAVGKGKGKIQDESPEFLALMELKERERKELEEIEERERDAWLRKSQILPLILATNEDFFNKYWPAPITEPEPTLLVTESTTKPKGKCRMVLVERP